MSDSTILIFAVVVFTLMLTGLILTIITFRNMPAHQPVRKDVGTAELTPESSRKLQAVQDNRGTS